jgi:hypothetical protein
MRCWADRKRMSERAANDSWMRALGFYESLARESGWTHIRAFIEFVAVLGRSREAAGLTAITSHETLSVSPYTRYPDWFEGRRVVLHPNPNGTLLLSRARDGTGGQVEAVRTVPLEEALPLALSLFAEL